MNVSIPAPVLAAAESMSLADRGISAAKVILTGFVVVFAVLLLLIVSPLDAIPDFIPIAGQVDDVLYALGIASQAIKLIRERRAQETAAGDIIDEPRA